MIDLYEVVNKLVGPIEPVGETNVDYARLENLKKMTKLLDCLMNDVADVARYNKTREEHSMNKAGKHAHSFFAKNGIEDY